ncbi:MAG: protein kinase [Planctomycetota bacterium]|nr:protein kinase [Planctomycetota bacterium]
MNAPAGSFDLRPDGDRFGELAVAMGLLKPEQVSAALKEQAAKKSQGKAPPLGEILYGQGLLDLRSIQRVLLEQTRKRKAGGGASGSRQTLMARRRVGHYELLQKLGEGGMGAVYKARDTQMDRVVALKVIKPEFGGNATFVERFKREVRATGQFNHPNIVAAYSAGVLDDVFHLAMEYVEGQSLVQAIQALGRLPEKNALKIARDAAAGLGHAHQQGFVHRDVKPDNVLLGNGGEVKVTDLGLAKSIEDDQRLTKTGVALGTPNYISPEQARGDKNVDRRSDIYSLGATLYVMLTGRVPFKGKNNAETMHKHLTEELESPQDLVPEISDGAVAVVSKMMAKEPDRRYADCGKLIEDLEHVLAGRPPAHATEDALERSSVQPPRRRRKAGGRARAKSGGGCLVFLAILAAAGAAGLDALLRLG